MEGASTAPSFASSEVISNWHWLLAIWIFHVLITDGVTVHKIHGSVQFTVLWLWFLVQFGIRWSLGKSNSLCLVKLKEWGSVKSDASLWQSEVKKRWDSGNARKKTLPNKWKACWNWQIHLSWTNALMIISKFKTKSFRKQSKFSSFNYSGRTLSRKKYCGYFKKTVETVHNILSWYNHISKAGDMCGTLHHVLTITFGSLYLKQNGVEARL